MTCTSCDHTNPDDARFCNSCGEALAVGCATCSRANPPASRFCNGCGADLTAVNVSQASEAPTPRDYTPRHLAEKILRNKAALEGERKHVTVLFADLADSTELAEQLGPEEMHALMDRAFRRILARVHHYEGTINQFTGDGVMALFGAPLALEDAPRRAVTAAIAIHRELETIDSDLQQSSGRRFQMRIGINTGPVVVGTIGDDLRMDYTAVGDTTNMAARLEALAPAGGVVVSDTTKRLAEGFFDFRALGPMAVKGKSGTIKAYQVLAERQVSSRIEALTESELTPFVGRGGELESLLKAFESARTGRGQLAFLVGEAGIGKSRLLHEFRRSLGDTPHTWFEGRCASFARNTPFFTIVDGLRRRAGIDDRDDETTRAEKLARSEADAGGELEWTLPFMRQLLSLPSGDPEVDALDPMTRRSESSRALLARLLRSAARRPLVMVIEDLHWIDTASEEFLGFLADAIAAARVLLIFTHRPGYEQPFGDRSFHVRIPLQALSSQAMTDMVQSVLDSDELPSGLQQLVGGKAEGNPFFIEEVVRSLVEEGVIGLREGVPYLARDLAGVHVPDRIQDVLTARLDRLEEGPKHAIQIASVIGREFALRLLERITETGDGLDSIVGELRSLELIHQKSAYPELAYMFKHALTHDVAYESILVQRRKMLHRIVGAAIEELYDDRLQEHYEALAHHFGLAEEWEQALRYHELASEKSAAAYANHAAVEHCRAALSIADRLEEPISSARLGSLAQRMATCSWYLSEFRASGEAFDRAADFNEDPGDRALLLAQAAFSYLWNHDYDRSIARSDEASVLAVQHDAGAAGAYAAMARDELELVHGRGATDDEIGIALKKAQHSGDSEVQVHLLQHVGQRAEWQGDYRQAIEMTQQAVDLAAENRNPVAALFGQWFLAIANVAIGDYGRGFEMLSGGLKLSDQIGDRALKARMLNTMGWFHSEIGCHSHAVEFNHMGTNLAREMVDLDLVAGAPELYANAAINLAGNLIALGEPAAAQEQLAAIEEQLETDDDPWMKWRWSLHLLDTTARLALSRGDAETALAKVETELLGTRQRPVLKLEARALELRGRVLLTMDRRDEAVASLSEALELARRIEHPPVAWRALSLLGEVADRNGLNDAQAQCFAELRRLAGSKASSIPRDELRSEFRGLIDRLISDPMGSYR
jgi:class 3 adenylate cyclase/tetratricopeptide (TPR) repeat protein